LTRGESCGEALRLAGLGPMRHWHRVFLLSLRRQPAAAVALVMLFVVVAVAVVGLASRGPGKFLQPAMAWVTATIAIGVASYLTAAVYSTMGRVTGPVLMLDIDGVLHLGQCGRLNKLPLLQQWLREHPTVQVVISSDWRYTHGFEKVRSLFDDDLPSRVIGSTPIHEGAPREIEVLHAVKQWHIKVWATLDDMPEGFPSTAAQHLIQTNPLFGLVESDLVVLAERLGVVDRCRSAADPN
jgi:hypothetical protein